MRATAGAARQGTVPPTPCVGGEVTWVQRHLGHLGHLALEPKVTATPDMTSIAAARSTAREDCG